MTRRNLVKSLLTITMAPTILLDAKSFNQRRSAHIIQWLSDHELISRNRLCTIVGYDHANLMKAFDGTRSIPEKYLVFFENELKEYGYRPVKKPNNK